jgi:hypothetical protein
MAVESHGYIPPEFFGLSDEEAQGLYREGVDFTHWEHFTPDFVGTKAQAFDLEQGLHHVREATHIYQEGRLSQREGTITLRNGLPITVFFIGDVHFGSLYTDHALFMSHIRQIAESPNSFVVFMSNLIDNAMPSQFPSNMLVNALPPDKQVVAIRKITQELDQRGKVLGAVTSSCHEGWTYKHTGQDINALMFGYEGRKFPVLENGGRLNLQFPGRSLVMALYHKTGPFESNFNETHSIRQMNRLRLNMEGDIVVAAHKHFAAAEVVYEGIGQRHRKPVAYIRSGTYKGVGDVNDRFAVDNYATTGEPGGQSVTIWPDRGMMDAHLDFDLGIMAQHVNLAYAVGTLQT